MPLDDVEYDHETHKEVRKRILENELLIEEFIDKLVQVADIDLSIVKKFWNAYKLDIQRNDMIFIDLMEKQNKLTKQLLDNVATRNDFNKNNNWRDSQFDMAFNKEISIPEDTQVDYGSMSPTYRIDDPIPVSCCVVDCEKPWINCLRIEEISKIFFSCYDHFLLLFNKGADMSKRRNLSIIGIDYESVGIWKGNLPLHDFADFITNFNIPKKMDRVRGLRQSGMSWTAIAKELNISTSQLRKWRKEHMPDTF